MKKQIMILLVACQLFGGGVFCMDKKKLNTKEEERDDDRFKRPNKSNDEIHELNFWECCFCDKELQDNDFCALSKCNHGISCFNCLLEDKKGVCKSCKSDLDFDKEKCDDFKSLFAQIKILFPDILLMSRICKEMDGLNSDEYGIIEGRVFGHIERLFHSTNLMLEASLVQIALSEIFVALYEKLTDKEKETVDKDVNSIFGEKLASSYISIDKKSLQDEKDKLEKLFGTGRYKVFESMVKRIVDAFFVKYGNRDAFNVLNKFFTEAAKKNKFELF